MHREVPDHEAIPGEEELTLELFGNGTELLERVGGARFVVRGVVRDRCHLPTISDGPVVAAHPSELDTARQLGATGFWIEQRGCETERVQGAAGCPVVADGLG